MNEENSKTPAAAVLNKSCELCRRLKIRCIIPEGSTTKQCVRCLSSGQSCTFLNARKRKQQRQRTDSRIAELEKKIGSMHARLTDQMNTGSKPLPRSGGALEPHEGLDSNTSTHSEGLRQFDSAELGPPALDTMAESSGASEFTIDGHLNPVLATKLFDIYNNALIPHFPCVVFPRGYKVLDLEMTESVLYLAIMAAAAATFDPGLAEILNQKALTAYANKTMVSCQKSLELVQSALVLAVWYSPPKIPEHLKYYEMTAMATAMALDIGLASKDEAISGPYSASIASVSDQPEDCRAESGRSMTDLDGRRTILICYIHSVSLSMTQRRPSLLKINNWINECMDVLSTSIDALLSDRLLVSWGKLLKIAEEVITTLYLDDMSSEIQITELRVQATLRYLKWSLNAWYKEEAPVLGALKLMFYQVNIFLHEVALHSHYTPESFRPLFTHSRCVPCKDMPTSSPTFINALSECAISSQRLIETFLLMDVDSLRALPVGSYIRVWYGLSILAKLEQVTADSNTHIGVLLDPGSIKFNHYQSQVIDHMTRAIGPMNCNVPQAIIGVIQKMEQSSEMESTSARAQTRTSVVSYGDESINIDGIVNLDKSIVDEIPNFTSSTNTKERTAILSGSLIDGAMDPNPEMYTNPVTFDENTSISDFLDWNMDYTMDMNFSF